MGNRLGRKPEADSPKEWVYDSNVALTKLKAWYPEIAPDSLSKLVSLLSEINTANKALSLVPIQSLKLGESLHIADSILASRVVARTMIKDAPLHDLAGGNGLPGIVFAVLYPEIKVIISDRDPKKIEMCRRIGAALKLGNLATSLMGVDDIPEKSVTNGLVRGYAPLQKTLLVARKSFVKGGKLFHLKGDAWANELASVSSQLFSFWTPSLLGQYKLPEGGVTNAVVLTDKTND